MREWTLRVEFDDAATQEERFPEYAFPDDDATRFVQHLRERWDLLPDDLEDRTLMVWDATSVEVYPEVLDYVAEPVGWLLMNTIPRSVTLTRTG